MTYTKKRLLETAAKRGPTVRRILDSLMEEIDAEDARPSVAKAVKSDTDEVLRKRA